MVGWCHQSYQHEFDPTLAGSGRQEGLACSGPWGHEEQDMTKQLNNNKLKVNLDSFISPWSHAVETACSQLKLSVQNVTRPEVVQLHTFAQNKAQVGIFL